MSEKTGYSDCWTYPKDVIDEKIRVSHAEYESYIDGIRSVGEEVIQSVEDKGDEVLESIPDDYSELVDEVSELKSDLNSITTSTPSTETVTPLTAGLSSLGGYIRKSTLSYKGYIYSGNYTTYYFKTTEDVSVYITGSNTLCLRISTDEPAISQAWTGELYDNEANNLPTQDNPLAVPANSWVAVWNSALDWSLYLITGSGTVDLASRLALTSTMTSEVQNMIGTTWYTGKTINWIGDSIVAGSDFDELVCEKMGMTERDYGIDGSTIAVGNNPSLKDPIILRYENMDNDADVIAVSAGTNDWMYAWTEIGDMDSTVNTTFYGALKNLCEGLIAKYPKKLIFFTTPIKRAQAFSNGNGGEYTEDGVMTTPYSKNKYGKTLGDYADIIKEVCGYYSIPVLDMYRESLLNPHLTSQQDMFDTVLTHPNTDGRKIMARRICGWLTQLAF